MSRNKDEESVFYEVDGRQYIDEDLALAALLKDGVLFSNSRPYSFKEDGKSDGHTVVLFVLANDLFANAVADGEDLPYEEIGNLYKLWNSDRKWGASKWCCLHRNEKPISEVVKYMQADLSWNDVMEKLPENRYEKICKEKFKKEV